MINDPTKDVLVIYYKPWEKVSQNILEFFVEYFVSDVLEYPEGKYKDLILAKMDISENDIDGLDIRASPQFYFFPKDNKQGVQIWKNRESAHIITWLVEDYGYETLEFV